MAQNRYSNQRQRRTPPHVSLKVLRKVAGLTLDDVCAQLGEVLGTGKPFSRGALSAVESGLRGPSQPVLDALAVVYGLEPGDLVLDFEPRARDYSTEVGVA